MQELDILTNDFRQGFALVGRDTQKDSQFFEYYRTQLSSSHKVIYVDFKNISNMYDLAEAILDQCYAVLGSRIDKELQESLNFWREEEDYRFLNKVLQVPQTIAEKLQITIIFWNENFTEALGLQDGSSIYEMMRGTFQMQCDVVHIFTSHNIDLVNNIFMDRSKPFFRFARIVKLSERQLEQQ